MPATPFEYICIILPSAVFVCAVVAYLVSSGFMFVQSSIWVILDEIERRKENKP